MTHPNPAPTNRLAAKTYQCGPPRRIDPVLEKPAPGPDSSPALADALTTGAAHLSQGRLGAALAAFDRAASLAPKDPAAQLNRGVVLCRLGRQAEARSAFGRAVRLAPDWPEAHHGLGRLQLGLGDARAASDCLRRAVELAPHWNATRHQFAVALQRLGRRAEAETELLESYRAGPDDPAVVEALAIFYSQDQDWDEAAEWAERLVARNRADPRTRQLLESILERSRD